MRRCSSFLLLAIGWLLSHPAANAQTTVLTQDFEGGLGNWEEFKPAGTTADWTTVTSGSDPTCSPQQGTRMAKFNSYSATLNHYAWLDSPFFDLSGAEVAECRFFMYHDSGYLNLDDQILFHFSVDNQRFFVLDQYIRASASDGWQEHVVPLGFFTAYPGVKISLLGLSARGNNIFVDNIRITKATLPAGAEGKACNTGADCTSGLCGLDPGGNKRCRAATTTCIDGNRQPAGLNQVVCYGFDVARCTGTDQWSVIDCTTDCGPYADIHGCDLGECASCVQTCNPSTDEGCAEDAYCEFNFVLGYICSYKLDNGELCLGGSECRSGYCVDSPAGDSFCEAANTCANTNGSPVAAGSSVCYNNNLWTCQAGGAWSTQDCYRNCGFYLDVDQCTGGACRACATSCSTEAECKSGIPCADFQCIGDLPDGSTCEQPSQCSSDLCVDGRCCATDCPGACKSCNVPDHEGTCMAVPAGSDPDGECAGEGVCDGSCNGQGACQFPGSEVTCATCTRCDGQGHCQAFVPALTDPANECPACRACSGSAPSCAPVPAGQDPLEDCAVQPSASCGKDGVCDGVGSCRYWPAGTECAQGSCSEESAVFPDVCNGLGQCIDGGVGTCGLFRCADIFRCADACVTHATCKAQAYCSAAGSCAPDLGEGASCKDVVYPGQLADAACISGFCFRDNFDDEGAFCASKSSVCVHDGMSFDRGYRLCDGDTGYRACQGGALAWSELVSCEEGPCDAGGGASSGYREAGACANGPDGGCLSPCNSCEPYRVGELACLESCTDAGACWPGYECKDGQCVVPEGIGKACANQSECTAGTCVDHVCCISNCVGPCRACNLPGRLGFCTMAAEGTDPDEDCQTLPASSCSTTGMCDGHGLCDLWPVGTSCAEPRCQDSMLVAESTCNGFSVCISGSLIDCKPGRCSQNACDLECRTHADCDQAGFCGSGGTCQEDLSDGASCDDITLEGLETDPACLGGFCWRDSWSGEGAYCASEVDACVATGGVYPPGYRLCQADEWFRVCEGGESGWGREVACPAANICDAGSGPGSGVRQMATCVSGLVGGCMAPCESCFPFMAQEPGICATSCEDDLGCWPGYTCSEGTCLPKAKLGDACLSDEDCGGWTCVDEVCCNVPCDDDCHRCDDPTAKGACILAAAGSDPGDDCEASLDVCGQTGVCDADGACALKEAGAECVGASCNNGILSSPSRCDGMGQCIPGARHSCPSGSCDQDRCADETSDSPPVAEAGPLQVVKVGQRVTLDGSQSYDPDGSKLTYLWEQTSGPLTVGLSDTEIARPSFVPTQAGVYLFRLLVNDGVETSTPDFAEVRVESSEKTCGCAASGEQPAAWFGLLCLVAWVLRRRCGP